MRAAYRRATVYLDSQLHRLLRLKALETDRSVSDIINEAVRQSLAEDAADLTAVEERAHEPWLRFEDVVKDMKKRGLL